MAKDKYKGKHMAQPVESHATAAWASQSQLKAVSKVNIPDEQQVENARDYVNENQK
jgi:hypothetical protein